MSAEGQPLAILTEESERQLAALRRGIKRAAGFVLYVVVAKDLGRVELLRRLKTWSGVGGFPELRFFGAGEEGVREIEGFLAAPGDETPAAGAVIQDGSALIDVDQGEVLATLNVSRDVLPRKIRGPLLLILRPERQGDFVARAPDLFDVRGGSVVVEAEALNAAPVLLATIATELEGPPLPMAELRREAVRLRVLADSDEPPLGALSDAWARLAHMYLAHGEHGEAREAALLAMQLAESAGYSYGHVMATILEGRALQGAGDLEGARSRYQRALDTAGAIGSLAGMAWADVQLGMLHHASGNLDDASGWYQRALATYEKLKFRTGVIMSLLELANVALAGGKIDDADAYAREALEASQRSDERLGLAESSRLLGLVAQLRGEPTAARAWYERSVGYYDGHREAAFVYPLLAIVQQQLGAVAEALESTIRAAILSCDGAPNREPDLTHLTTLTATLGLPALESAWQRLTGDPLPAHVRAHVEERLRASS